MKIKDEGFRVEEICNAIPSIRVDRDGCSIIEFRTQGGMDSSDVMPRSEFFKLCEAIDAIRERLNEGMKPSSPTRVEDRSGDVWVWRDDHGAYVIEENGHESCAKDNTLDDGSTLEWIERNWGPLKIIE